MKSTRQWVAATVLLMGAATAGAQQASAIRLAFNIQAQPLDAALTDFAQATGLQLLVLSDIAHERAAPKVAGSLTPEKALQELLQGSGLSYHFVNERTVAISSSETTRTSTMSSGGDIPESFRLAQAESNAETLAPAEVAGSPSTADKAAAPEILVRGSRILNIDIPRSEDDVQPYVIFNRQVIEKSGAHDIEGFLRQQLVAGTSTVTQAQSDTGSSQSFLDLRGLGSTQTLILIDGRRVASQNSVGNAGQPDLNGIPLAAVERIEVLPTTASGIYGGSATGGVVNVVLRRDYEGIETKISYEDSFKGGGASRQVSATAGFSLEDGKTNVMVTASFRDSEALLVEDRDFLRRGRDLVLANNPDAYFGNPFVIPLGSTTNIVGVDMNTFGLTDLTLKNGTALNSPFTSVPRGYAGVASDGGSALASNAGSYNFESPNTVQLGAGGRQSLLNDPTVKSASFSVRREFLPWLEAFVDLSASKNTGSFAMNRVSGAFLLGADAPSNPFQQAIYVTTPAFGTDTMASVPSEDYRGVGGVIFKLSGGWTAGLDYTWNRNKFSSSALSSDLDPTAFGAVTDGTLDIFRDTNAFPVTFAPYLVAPTVVDPTHTTMKDVTARIAGSLGIALPGGKPSLTVSLERREEGFDDYRLVTPTSVSLAYSREQTIDSLYIETRIPIVSSLNAMTGVELLELQLAGRRDEYNMVGANNVFAFGTGDLPPADRVRHDFSSTDETLGLRYRPGVGVTFRASYGTGFLPPQLSQFVPNVPFLFDYSFFGYADPLRDNEPLRILNNTGGGNPDLRPEQSVSHSVGVIFEPQFAPAFRVSLDWTRIRKHDNITAFGLTQENINNEASLPGVFTRGPASDGYDVGPIIGFNGAFINVARQEVEAYDLQLDYQVQTSAFGNFSFSGLATRNMHNETQVIESLAPIETVGTLGALKWQAATSLTWDRREWQAGWNTRFYGGYDLDAFSAISQGASSIGSQTYHDLTVAYRFGVTAPSEFLQDLDLRFGVRNVFNTQPPILTSAPFYSTLADPRLRTYFLSIRKGFH